MAVLSICMGDMSITWSAVLLSMTMLAYNSFKVKMNILFAGGNIHNVPIELKQTTCQKDSISLYGKNIY